MDYGDNGYPEDAIVMASQAGLRRRAGVSAQELRESAALLLARAEHLDARPAEPEMGLAVFDKQFQPRGRVYRWAAVRSGEHWWLTGQTMPVSGSRVGLSWDGVLDVVYARAYSVVSYTVPNLVEMSVSLQP